MRMNVIPDTIPTSLRCSDVWETGFIRQLCGSLTFHVFEAPPTKVYVSRFQHVAQDVLILTLDSTLGAVRTS